MGAVVNILSAVGVGLPVLILIALGVVLYRNDWVYWHMVEAIAAGRTGLPSYSEAMRRFWVWDFEKLIKKGTP